jgi:hypothetical protein
MLVKKPDMKIFLFILLLPIAAQTAETKRSSEYTQEEVAKQLPHFLPFLNMGVNFKRLEDANTKRLTKSCLKEGFDVENLQLVGYKKINQHLCKLFHLKSSRQRLEELERSCSLLAMPEAPISVLAKNKANLDGLLSINCPIFQALCDIDPEFDQLIKKIEVADDEEDTDNFIGSSD